MHAFYSRFTAPVKMLSKIFSEINFILLRNPFNKESGPETVKNMQEKKALTAISRVCNMYALRQGCPSGAPAFFC
jgi:hypothetical protein